jgi:hypothetical protein
MSSIVGADLVICNTQEEYNKLREEKDIRYIKSMEEINIRHRMLEKTNIRCKELFNIEKLKQINKESNKRGFINQFINEIPELSYYEAAQLKKKLGNIYVEWNDE